MFFDWTEYCDGTLAYAEIEESGELIATFVEELDFHRKRTGDELDDLGAHRVLWGNALTAELRRHTSHDYDLRNNLSVEWEEDNGEQMRIEIYIPGDWEDDDDIEKDILWPLYASLMNISDPGTFGSRYVYEY